MPAVTLFVRRLPATATNANLAEVFSEIGPLKNCFVVGDRETKKCRGFGYVTFSMEDDAQRAIKEVREYEGEKIFVTVAKKKPDNKKKKKKVKTEEDSEDKTNPKHEPTETKSPAKSTGIKKNKLKARLIIRNLSFKCEEDDLKQIFSEFGTVMDAKIPLKPDGKKRGFAFVQFKNMAEAGKALAAMNLKEIKDRQVAVDWAIAKDKYLANQSAGAAGTIKEENVNSKGAGADGKEKEAKKKPTLQETKDDSESEEEEASEDDDDDEANSSEADNAENDSESQQTDSDASEPEDDDDDDDDSDDAEGKTPPKKKRDPLPSDVNEGRTIFIRNLAFDTDEEGLEEVLLQFGELKYVRVVMSVDTGYSKGCAFAQFKSKEAADKCIAAAAEDEKEFGGIRVDGRRLNVLPAVNREDATKFKDKKVKTHTGSRNLYLAREGLIRPGSKSAEGVSETDLAKRTRVSMKNRQVAVDWAIAKDKYLANQSAGAAGTIKEENVNSKGAGADGKEKEAKKKPTLQETKDDSESEEEEASEDDDDDEANSSEADNAENDSESQQTDSDASEPEDDDDDDDDSDDAEGKTPPKKKRDPLPSDVNEGRTIFIRNLAFDTDEEGLEEVLLQFGELKYVRVVMSVDTGYSKGCAFAQFKSKEAADKCIAAAAEDEKEFGGIRVDGRRLNVLPAVNREDATKFKDKKVKTHTGSRNLYLAREGLIRPGSKSAEGVSETDLAKRTRFEELKRSKLKDMNIYVSKTRLCVHNLPKNVDQQKLQKLCLSAAGGKGVCITECRVMYDKKPIRGQVIGKSLGYGFVAFKEHEHALQALRHLNNNPDIVGPQKRPIVEFSLEDGRKLKLKAIRLENSKKQLKKGSSQKGEQLPQQQQHSGKKKGPLRKGNAANVVKQEKEQGSQYSGFMTKPEVEHVELKDGKKRPKVLHMPSHRGPKIRKRDKGKQPMVQPKKQKKVPSRKERKGPTFIEKSSTNRKPNTKPAKLKFQNREDVRFDTLVNQYKKKLMGTSNTKTAVKKSKWFS
ncbi:RNA-binding protein 28-like [Sinocyclocheilus grahami]|uniref:RNA-binding protein 28-like n=1 Tax=Sinocyclocheilus grahami TaxID=75366 RepID=UPI0007AD430F|nr:PREDICTED: RNA-binding protein 28-like [Sinocyclocheilus grahami]